MKRAPHVQVLLATFNGERYLRQQIDSILAQTYEPLTLLIRDDGSVDGTSEIIAEYARRFPERVHILPADVPTGHAKENFNRLLAASTAPFVAFSDQDDVWLPEKITIEMTAMQRLEEQHGSDVPLLVFSDMKVVSEKLEVIADSFWKHQYLVPEKVRRLERSLVQNVMAGCTALLNAPLRALARDMPSEAHMHDWWIALLANLLGHWEPLYQPLVLYRQHDQNVFGARREPRPSGPPKRNHAMRRLRWEYSVPQTEALLRMYAEQLPKRSVQVLRSFLRCEHSRSRFVRVFTFLRHRFFVTGLRTNCGTAWYLWDMNAAKQLSRGLDPNKH